MAHIGLGTYRMTDLDPNHVAAIRIAVEAGVTLIDTSTNYMDGGAERAIAQALRGVSDETAAGVEIVSKFGYIQGSALERLKEEHFDDVVEYAEHVYHCIDAAFMRDQLTRSLERLSRDRIDCYLIHNPEYYLLDAVAKGIPLEERLDGMLQRIYDAFVAFEQEVKAGRIGGYGISSNGFAKPHTSEEFLPYGDLVTLAVNAARYAGNAEHSFTTVQFPLNLLERDGLLCAEWAKGKGLRVLVNRPLNAQRGSRMYRLADYDEPTDYFHHLNALLERFGREPELHPLYNMVSELDRHRHRFGWIGDYEQFYHFQVLPLLRTVLTALPEANRPSTVESLEQFFAQYRKMVAHECARRTRSELSEELAGCTRLMEQCAIEYLLGLETVDYVLAGMRKPAYIAEFIGSK